MLLAFAVTLVVAALLSQAVQRSILSTALIFLASGLIFRNVTGGTAPADSLVANTATLALVATLYTDGLRVRPSAKGWRLPGLALLIGLPLTLVLVAVLGRTLLGLSVVEALLVGAVLSPTDPVFASALIRRKEVPRRLQHLLSVESGLNDGLALPFVLVLLHLASGDDVGLLGLMAEVGLGLGIGLAVPAALLAFERTPLVATSRGYRPLLALGIGLLLFAVSEWSGANEFLAAFTGGAVVGAFGGDISERFREAGELLSEVLKVAAVFVFATLIVPSSITSVGLAGAAFAVFTLFVARPFALALALPRSELSRQEWVTAAWFGPRGLASVVYGLLMVNAAVPGSIELFHLVAVVVALSMILHSSSDILFVRWFFAPKSQAVSPAGE